MEPVFRSRGIRVLLDGGKISLQEKVYYEPNENCRIENKEVTGLMSRGLISLFEYAVVDDRIDTYNFHVNLTDNNFAEIFTGLPEEITAEFAGIRDCFGSSIQNYTLGYRLDGPEIVSRSYYFYPTVWRGTRYGIKGITHKETILHNAAKFSERIAQGDEKLKAEINDFASILYKFKGISVHVSEQVDGYKLYGRAKGEELRQLLLENCGYDTDAIPGHGEAVLAALRIDKTTVKGYNIYYLT